MKPAGVGSGPELLPDVSDRGRRAKPAKADLRRAGTDGRAPDDRGPVLRDPEGQPQADASAFETHFAVEDLARAWGMSEDFVRRLFLKEPGVVVFYNQRPGRRVYRTLRIPESVALRVHRRMRRG